jgi:hypothetical protein
MSNTGGLTPRRSSGHFFVEPAEIDDENGGEVSAARKK